MNGVAARLVTFLPSRPRLLQFGVGRGTTFTDLAPAIGRAQAWTLVDENADALDFALNKIADWAAANRLTVTFPGRAMLVHTPVGAWRVETRIVDLDTPPAPALLAQADAVLCVGLLPTVTRGWVGGLVAALRQPLLAPAVADPRTVFLPRHGFDRFVLSASRRAPGKAAALGLDAPATLLSLLRARGFSALSAPVREESDRPRPHVVRLLMDLHADRARRNAPARAGAVDAWRDVRERQAARRRLVIRPGARDILGIPNGAFPT